MRRSSRCSPTTPARPPCATRSPTFGRSPSLPAGRTAGRSSIARCALVGSGSVRRGSPPPSDESSSSWIQGVRSARARTRPRERASSCSRGLERGSLLDAGCGSGVVAVAAARFGFAPVVAVDLDEVAVEVAALTARANGVEIDVTSRRRAARRAAPYGRPRSEHRARASSSSSSGERPSTAAVTSGYLAAEVPRAPGWVGVDRLELEGWAADVFVERH